MKLTEEERKAIVTMRLDNAKQKSHAGIIRLLGLNFISKNLINTDLGNLYYKLFSLHQKSDYDDWVIINESDIQPLIEPAEKFITEIELLIYNSYF